MFLKSILKTSEGFLTTALTIGSVLLPDLPWGAFVMVGSYVLGRSWVKAKNGIAR